jgi:biotin carboxyl carrier protein
LKLRVTIDGESRVLDLERAAGNYSVVETAPGTYSVLLGTRSFTAHVLPDDVRIGERRFAISIADLRDRPAQAGKHAATGPLEIRAQMPGKVVRLLVESGSEVAAGQGLIVVEAMKMQNEMKAPRAGKVLQISAIEGASVAASEKLMVLE